MLAATSDIALGGSRLRSTLLLERAVRAFVVVRDKLPFDTRFAAAASGRDEPVGHLYLVLAGRVLVRDKTWTGPVAFVLRDDELERVRHDRSQTLRVDGDRVEVVLLRLGADDLTRPIGLANGPVALSTPCWEAAEHLIASRDRASPELLRAELEALASNGVITPRILGTLESAEAERILRLWAILASSYARLDSSISLKQVASSLRLSTRQVATNFTEIARTFGVGLGDGYRDVLRVLRLRAAALFLAAPTATITEVAHAVGYSGTNAMARAFRDAKLPAPLDVQRSLRGATSAADTF